MRAAILYGLWLAALSLALFACMGFDKRRAASGGRRVPELRLFLLALLGGGAGGWLGMYAFRHKTRKTVFRLGFAVLAAVQLGALIYLLSE